VPMNILKRDYVLWNASQRSEISFGPYNSSQGLDFEFLHSLGRLLTYTERQQAARSGRCPQTT